MCLFESVSDALFRSFRPGGELSPGEDEVEGLKRLMTEVGVRRILYAVDSINYIKLA